MYIYVAIQGLLFYAIIHVHVHVHDNVCVMYVSHVSVHRVETFFDIQLNIKGKKDGM